MPFPGGAYTLALAGGGTIAAGVVAEGVAVGVNFPTIVMMTAGQSNDGGDEDGGYSSQELGDAGEALARQIISE